jgi:adenosylhomocysteinase
MKYRVRDISLSESGKRKIEWAMDHMPVLAKVREEYGKEKPFEGMKIGACLHVTPETAALMLTLKAGGAHVRLSASNPLSTKDDVAASLVKDYGIEVFAVHGDSADEYYENIKNVLEIEPVVTLDDGGDLTAYLHSKLPELARKVWGGTEETTTGVIRFRAMEKDGVLQYPIIAVNDSKTKYLFDNRYGTGQSTIDGILRATNLLIAGSVFVVAGYGWCGRGLAMRAKGMGARVIVTEVDPVRALEAVMDGFDVMPRF